MAGGLPQAFEEGSLFGNETPVDEQHVGAVGDAAGGQVVFLRRHPVDERAGVQQRRRRAESIAGGFEEGADAQPQVVHGPRSRQRLQVGHLIVFEEAEVHE